MDIYHILNRGVEGRNIVESDNDRRRFVRDLYEMNDSRPIRNLWYRASSPFSDLRNHYDDRKRLVTIHGWCLMNNHYHILLSENCSGGLTTFLRKFNIGYANYFNEKHDRSGALFQGRTKKLLIEKDAHFLWILHYIHFNPLDFFKKAGDWRTQCLVSSKDTTKWLDKYKWSSYRDYLGEDIFSPILEGSFMFKDRKQHIKESRRYLSSIVKSPMSLSLLE